MPLSCWAGSQARQSGERRIQSFNFFFCTITFFLQLLDYSRQVCHQFPSAEDCISIRQGFPSCRVLDNDAKHENWTSAAFRCVHNSPLPAEAPHVLLGTKLLVLLSHSSPK